MTSSRPAAVAGTFYPASKEELLATIQTFLEKSQNQIQKFSLPPPKALLVPHAGYIYSGETAAFAYATLNSHTSQIKKVILLGPAHRVYIQGISLPQHDFFTTPLGKIEIDSKLRDLAKTLSFVSLDDSPHQWEHSIEVQLPFLQDILRDFTLLPGVVGDCSPEDVFGFLDALGNLDDSLIIISSDLSHFKNYAEATRLDQQTISQIQALQEVSSLEQACGSRIISGWIRYAKKHALLPHLLDYRNSGDTAGSRKEVVGYCAFAFTH